MVPPQAPRVAFALPNVAEAAIVFDDVLSNGQIWHGIHIIHPSWLPGRWMREQAEIELYYDADKHSDFLVTGLYEEYQLQQTGPVTLTVKADGRGLLQGTVSNAGEFRLESPLPKEWRSPSGIVRLQLTASPGWRPEGSSETYTLTLISVGFEEGHR